MKGLFFAKPLEYRLETPAELLVQGEEFGGSLAVTNRGAAPLNALQIQVGLTYGNFKKMKANEPDAYQPMLAESLARGFALEPGAEQKAVWSIRLARDCPITSSEGAVFLTYGGDLGQPGAWSKIDLQISLAPPLETFVTTVENHFAFAAGPPRFEEGFTEVRFKPPTSYPTMEEMVLRMRMGEKEEIELNFVCRLRKFERGAGRGVTTATATHQVAIPADKHTTFSGQPNRELFRATVAQTLEKIAPPPVKKK